MGGDYGSVCTRSIHFTIFTTKIIVMVFRREGNVLFNDVFNTFLFYSYGIGGFLERK